jgi:hypothetical protein
MTAFARVRRSPAERAREKARRRATLSGLARWTPVAVALVIIFLPVLLVKAIAAVITIGLVVAICRRPTFALTALLVFLPFQQLAFAGLYRLGGPAEVVRSMAQWKEAFIVGLLVAGIRKAWTERHPLDALDVLGFLYVALGVGYMLVPGLFVGDALGSSLDLTTRLLGWRTDVLYVALFLACRHLRLAGEVVSRLSRRFLVTAMIVAAIGFFEFCFPSTWNNIVVNWFDVPHYKLDVLNVVPGTDPYLFDVRVYTSVAGHDVLRIGSVLLQYWALGYYMVIAAALCADRIVRGLARTWHYVALTMCGAAVLLTETRSAVFALVVVLAVTQFRRSQGAERSSSARVKFSLVVAAIAVVAVPAALALGLVDRFNGEDDFSSNESHHNSFDVSYGVLVDHPLGRGLSTAAGAGQRADVNGVVVTETQFLQIGTQLGLVGLALWVAFVVNSIITLGRAALRAPPWAETSVVTATRTAIIGLFAAGTFLQVFIEFTLSWSIWILAGLALGAVEREVARTGGARAATAA